MSVAVFVEWMDGDGNTWEPPGPPSYSWPDGLELPRVGDTLEWPAFYSPRGRKLGAAEVVGRRWTLADDGLPYLLLTCDLGAYSGGILGARS